MSSLPGKEEIKKAIEVLEKNIERVDELSKEVEKIKQDSQYVTAFVTKVDVPDRSCLCKVLTDNGLKEMVLRTWTDSLALKILEEYSRGKSKFIFRIAGGFIAEMLPDDFLPGKVAELSEVLSRTPHITSQLSEDDRVAESNVHPNDTSTMKSAVSKMLHDWEHAKRR